MDIVWLGQGECGDCRLVGGKGAGLCHLVANHRVPPAFCITAAAFTRWAAHTADSKGLYPALYSQLATAYQQMAIQCDSAELSVAVRSSAVDEDSQSASFAGQHQTFLNVSGLAAIAQAIVGCWDSARSDHALAYRRQQALLLASRMAVLVQQFIPADLSAVVFSANPVSGQRAEMMINANWGLGESIVSGTVTPDTFIIRKADLAVVTRHLADKQSMTIPAPGGTRTLPTPRFLRRQSTLSDTQIAELAHLGLILEQTQGRPVDVECAYQGGRLYLLQCRPITTL